MRPRQGLKSETRRRLETEMKTFMQIVLLLALLAAIFGVGILALIVGPNATLPTLVLMALAQAVLFTLAIRTGMGLS